MRAEDLAVSVRAFGQVPSQEQLQNMVEHFDLYHRGYFDFQEYCIMMAVYGHNAVHKSRHEASGDRSEEACLLFDQRESSGSMSSLSGKHFR